MPTRPLLRRSLGVALTSLLALTLVPFDTSPAEARGIKFRSYSATRSTYANRAEAEGETRRSGAPFGVRIYGFGSSSQDERSAARAKTPGAAAAAAARARAALEADGASRPAAAVHTPLPIGETKRYENGVMCVAGC